MDPRAIIEDVLRVTADGLQPLLTGTIREVLPEADEWTQVLKAIDLEKNRGQRTYNPQDANLVFRILTERLGPVGYPFTDKLGQEGRRCASELREVRNKWAHYEELSVAQAYRAVDTAQILLEIAEAEEHVRRLDAHKIATMRELAGPAVPEADSGEDHGKMPSDAPSHASASGHAAISLDVAETPLNYARVRRGLSIINELSVDWAGFRVQGASVEITVEAHGEPLGDPTVHIVDLNAEQGVEIPNQEIRLDPRRMSEIDTVSDGVVRVAVRHPDGTLLGNAQGDISVWPARFWAIPDDVDTLSHDLLSSYVQPQAPVIDEILKSASEKLVELGYDGGLDANQQGDDYAIAHRTDEIVEAIYETIRERGVQYSNPPATWRIGQAIRTPDQVLNGGVGTCMDTTLVMAAALEQAGINPLLCLVPGHIFLGYWRDSRMQWPSVAMTAAEDIAPWRNIVGSNALVGPVGFVETTLLTKQGSEAGFAYARELPFTEHVMRPAGHFWSIIDVRAARHAKVYPLPYREISGDGEITVHEYHAESAPKAEIYSAETARDYVAPGQESVPPRVRQWKNSLLDLSLRNKLLNYTAKKGHALAVPPGMVATFEDIINSGRTIELIADDKVPSVRQLDGIDRGSRLPEEDRAEFLLNNRSVYVDKTDGAFQSSLRAVATKARTIAEETGANNLYLAIGRLNWNVRDKNLQSPLILVPVSLTVTARGTRFTLSLDDSGESTPNYCLLEKLKVEHQLEIPALANPMRDDAGIDIPTTISEVRKALAKAQVPFTVEETVDLAILDFAKFRLWKDLDESWEQLAGNYVVRHLIETPTEAFEDSVAEGEVTDLDELALHLPVPADASQADAVAEAVSGRTFVLEGPPGTGKSQTITNLLAHAMSEGKTVLFVAEKRAALDVVKDRLDSVGLGDFSLDLHDKSTKLSAVRAQIRTALDASIRADQSGLQTQRELARSSRGSLKRYADRLHGTNAAGFSLYSAREKVLAADESIEALPVPEAFVEECTEDQLTEVRRVLRFLPEHVDMAAPRRNHPWGFWRDPASVTDASAALDVVTAFDAALEALREQGITAKDLDARSSEEIRTWARVARTPRAPLDRLDAFAQLVADGTIESLRGEIRGLVTQQQHWATVVQPHVLATDVEGLHAAAVAADEAGMFSRKKRRQEVRASIAQYFLADPAQFDLKWLSALTADIARAGAAVRDLRQRLLWLPLAAVDAGWNPFIGESAQQADAALAETSTVAAALDARQPGGDFVREYFAGTPVEESLAAALERFLGARESLVAQFALPTDAGTGRVILDEWTGGDGFLAAWTSTTSERGRGDAARNGLHYWHEYLQHTVPLRELKLDELWERVLVGDIQPDDAVLGFERGLAEVSVQERTRSSLLASFDPKTHVKGIERFAKASGLVREELPRALPAEILGRRRFDPQNENGKLGELRRQLNRQRGGMKVRELFEKYGALLTDIMPCVLTSPESVARYFPPKQGLFDIVVFDEASQIRVADAVGALGRARSAVVVGDSKQMPPTSFGESNGEEGIEDEDVVVDEESILSECVQSRIPRKWLSWHYRSQNEGLIFFSNHAYYESRLSSFPAPTGAGTERGVSLVRVNGQFLRPGSHGVLRTNPVEAEAIAAEVARRFAESHDKMPSLGIVTFNSQQRDHITSLLRELEDERVSAALEERDGLFVKNLENVQGDERDVILFSVAFSKNEKGVLPLNFGPLSRAGGERRLNVAITRARRQVVLYASFDPEDLRVEETASIGLKHLRQYLELARSGAESHADTSVRQPVLDRHRDEIAGALRERGFAVTTDVGLSDFRVDITVAADDAPDEPLVAVLLDGEGWRERRTVADRDGLPVDVLKNLMKWPAIERVWLPEWLQQQDATLGRLERVVEEAVKRSHAGLEAPKPLPSAEVSPEPRELAPEPAFASVTASHSDALEPQDSREREDGTIHTFASMQTSTAVLPQPDSVADGEPAAAAEVGALSAWPTSIRGGVDVLDSLPSVGARQRVARVAEEVIACEEIVHEDRLARLVGNSFGLSRVTTDRKRKILASLAPGHRVASESDFFAPIGFDPQRWRNVRAGILELGIKLDEVSLVEIANAMTVSAERAFSLEKGDLFRAALNLLGGTRLTSKISDRLEAGFSVALSMGRIADDGDGHFSAAR